MISFFHRTSYGRFILLLTGISLAYAFWLIACWPGVLGQDSLAILYEVGFVLVRLSERKRARRLKEASSV